ncbi:MAG: formylglycine-generating enzyme family protein, partial [Planctomycetota bacterium]
MMRSRNLSLGLVRAHWRTCAVGFAAFLLLVTLWVVSREPMLFVFGAVPVAALGLWFGKRGRPVLEWVDDRAVSKAMVEVPAGSFRMGTSRKRGAADERPEHLVTLAGFWLWRTPLTRAEYRSVMPADAVPEEWTEAEDGALPANHVDFYTAVRCCNALSKRDGLAPYYELR